MRKMLLVLLVLVFFSFDASILVVWGHGGGTPQLTNEPAGPYRVFAWTQPEPVQVGELHLTLAVTEPPPPGTSEDEGGAPVLDAVIDVELRPLKAAAQAISTEATHGESANKLFYEADVEIPVSGTWEVVISIDGPEGPGETRFEIEAEPESSNNWIITGVIALSLIVVGLLVLVKRRPRQTEVANA